MSVRAYRVNKIIKEKSETFNLWHDEIIFQWLTDNGKLESLNDDCGGFLDITTDEITELINVKELTEQQRADLKKDYDWAIKNKTDWIRYECF